MKLKNIKKVHNEKNTIKEGIKKVVKLIQKWSNRGAIAGVVELNSIIKREDYHEIKYQIYKPRVIRSTIQKIQIYFRI